MAVELVREGGALKLVGVECVGDARGERIDAKDDWAGGDWRRGRDERCDAKDEWAR